MPTSERTRRLLQVGAVLSYSVAGVLLVTAFLDYWGSLDAPSLGPWPGHSWWFFVAIPFLALGGYAGWYSFRRPEGGSATVKCQACGSLQAMPATVCSQCAAPL